MSSLAPGAAVPTTRRILLLDLDWADADRIPEILRQPGASVRLVAGTGPRDPGVRMAEMCGLPHTLDLADLTREIFDVAVIGERGSRRTQLESLLIALGTPCLTPSGFLDGHTTAEDRPGVDAPLAVHAVALEQSLSGSTDALVDAALPDLSEPTPLAPREVTPADVPRMDPISLADFPSHETRRGLEDTLVHLVSGSRAGSAQVHVADHDALRLVAQVGPEDRLLRGLIDLAHELGTPQVVTRQSEPGKGLTWAAWPFRTLQRRGVLAGAAIDGEAGLASWQATVEGLRADWDREDRERSASSFPLMPARESRWLDPSEFRERVALAVERHRRDGLRFELHRLEFPTGPEAVERFCGGLPARVRDTDSMSRPAHGVVTLLVAGAPDGLAVLRHRLLAAWEEAWSAGRTPPPAPAFVDRSVALAGPEDREAFLMAAEVWTAAQ
ncbi:MAG: hypothetical protein ACKO3S_11555 [bacterium]